MKGDIRGMVILRYRWNAGSVAWIIHRVSGAALALYVFAHIYVLSGLKDPERFKSFLAFAGNPFVKAAEFALLAAVAAHALNGVRLTAIELGVRSAAHKKLLWAAAIAFALVMALGAIVMPGGGH